MNYEEIHTFLVTLDCGSIAKAAETLYISQGTASTRIQQLENELGTSLFFRQKGIRRLSLTKHGEEFLPIAQQWFALYQDALNIKNLEFYQELKIAATDSLNLFIFAPLYNHFISHYDNIYLTIKTHHSSEIHRLVDNQICDIGFCTNCYNYPNIIFTPLYEDSMALIVHKDHPYNISLDKKTLLSCYEVFLPLSNEFTSWHNQYFHDHKRKFITVGTISMQEKFLINQNTWTIMSNSAAHNFIKSNPHYTVYKLDDAPKRTVFLLTYKYPKPGIKKVTQIFVNELTKFLQQNKNINFIYNQSH